VIQLLLPYPPASGNKTTRHTRGGGHYTLPEISRYRDHVRLIVERSIVEDWCNGDDSLECVMEIYPPDRRKRDMDNVCKVVSDALTKAGVWSDDFQIDRLVLIRKNPEKHGLVKVSASVIRKE
jgi:crossover junction endodeoxyribonuclease RusA